MVNQLIEAFVTVFKWKVNGNQIVSTRESISNNEDIQAQVKHLPDDDPLVYQQKDLIGAFEFWCRDNQVTIPSVEMSRGDFWNSPDEAADASVEMELKAKEAEVDAQILAAEKEQQGEEGLPNE